MTFLSSIKARIANRSDTELEQALLRIVIGVLLIVYLQIGASKYASEWLYTSNAYLIWMGTFMLVSFAIVAANLAWPLPSPMRRVVANVCDIGTNTFLMLYGNEYTTPLFAIYLWVTFGCGFRFGPRYIGISLALSTVGFWLVLTKSNYWPQHGILGVGLLVGMIALSLYVLLLTKRLHLALKRAAAANEAKRKFVSSVTHELRTPLNAIIGMNDMLSCTVLDSEQSEIVRTMHGASRVMLSLIEGVLDFSKIEAGKLTKEHADFDLHALVQSTIAIFSQQAAVKGLKLGVLVMPDVTPAVRGDARHLQQILLNLVGNAVKFTDHGEVQLTVSALSQNSDTVRIRFAVRDTGIGIPIEEQERIFESFAQVQSPSHRKHRGTGLGTTIAKQLAELLGGTIGLESASGAGSTFWFDAPFTKQELVVEEAPTRFADARAILVGLPSDIQKPMTAALSHWEMESGCAESMNIAAARLSEATALGHPYRVAMLYAETATSEIAHAAAELRKHGGKSLAIILCAPRYVTAQLAGHVPAEVASIVSLPLEKRMLYNALHSVLAGEEVAAGVVSMADFYKRKAPTKSYNILVADDDQVNRRVIAKQLEMAGHTAKLVINGEEVLDALDEEDANYDVIILDSNMPVMTGLEATRLIRVMEVGHGRVPIILFSADTTSETIEEAKAAGVDVFLAKPVEASQLLATIEQLTEKGVKPANVVLAIAPSQRAPSAALITTAALTELERMSQDPRFVARLVQMFVDDSSGLLLNIEDSLSKNHHEEFKRHVHALKGSALNLGADRLVAHCSKIGVLNSRELKSDATALATETRLVITQTQDALADYVRTHVAASA